MSQPFFGEICLWAFNWAPQDWALCEGQVLPISSNSALFSLLGTNFGGDGRTSFGLPDMRSRSPVGFDGSKAGYDLGDASGFEAVTLQASQMPAHSHHIVATTDEADTNDPTGNMLADSRQDAYKVTSGPYVAMDPQTVGVSGSGQAHDNMQPSLGLNFAIALHGEYPARN